MATAPSLNIRKSTAKKKADGSYKSSDPQAQKSPKNPYFGTATQADKAEYAKSYRMRQQNYQARTGKDVGGNKETNIEAAQRSSFQSNPTSGPQRLGTPKADLPRLGSMVSANSGPASKTGYPKPAPATKKAPPSHGAGGYPAPAAAKQPFNSSGSDYYRGPNRGLAQKPVQGAATPGSTSTFSGTSQSVKNPGVGTSGMSGTTTQRGNVKTLQTRYQRDSGLAMDLRKKK